MRVTIRVASTVIAMGLVFFLLVPACAGKPATTAPAATTTSAAPATTAASSPAAAPTTAKATATTAITAPPAKAPTGPYGQLTFAIGTFGNGRFDPAQSDATFGGTGLAPFLDYLWWFEKGKVTPGIGESWELAADGLSYIVRIRKGVKFHNGDALTARDVKFSIDRNAAPTANASANDVKQTVDHTDLIDDYTVRIYTKGPQPFIPIFWGPSIDRSQLFVTPKDYIEKSGMPAYEQKPVGSGSFKFVKNIPGDSIEYEAVDSHWREVPSFKNMNIVQMPEEATRVASLKTGTADVIEIGLENSAALEGLGYKTFIADSSNARLEFHAAYDPRAKGMPVADLRVRQALSLALDRETIGKTLFLGKTMPLLPPNITESSPDVDLPFWIDYTAKTFRYDPAAAKNLLAAAGYPDGFNINIYTFVLPGGGGYLPEFAQVVQAYWGKIGVKAKVVPTESGTYNSWRVQPIQDLVGQVATYRAPGTSSLAPRNINVYWSSKGGVPLLGKSFPEVDKMILEMLSTNDVARRKDLITQVVKIGSESFTMIPVATTVAPVGLSKNVDTRDLPFPLAGSYLSTYASTLRHPK